MNILLVHNLYRQKGGEYSVFQNEKELLLDHNHNVHTYTRTNSINNVLMLFEFLFNSTWSRKTYREISGLIKKHAIDVVHVHNFFPLISPSVFYAAKDAGVKTVFTLHNYRIFDPGALLMNDGSIDKSPLEGTRIFRFALQRRYRDSFWQTLRVGKMIKYHMEHETWQNKVDSFISLTAFAKKKFVDAGLPSDKVYVKPNFIEDPLVKYLDIRELTESPKSEFVFVGRISKEKGVELLVESWKQLPEHFQLTIVGDGPLKEELAEKTKSMNNISWKGFLKQKQVYERIASSSALILPSVCYENFPMAILESYALGTPVITSDIGGQGSLVKQKVTGEHFCVGDFKNLADVVLRFNRYSQNGYLQKMGKKAREEYESKYTPEKNYNQLINIYLRD